jgi:hypothetical protein
MQWFLVGSQNTSQLPETIIPVQGYSSKHASSSARCRSPQTRRGRPRDAEAVHDRAEPLRPEGLLQGNGDPSAVGELRDNALGRCGIVEIELELKTLRAFVVAGEDVAAGEGRAAHRQRGVQDLVASFSGRLVGHRRVAPREAERHDASEKLLVEGERPSYSPLKTRLMRGSIRMHQSWPTSLSFLDRAGDAVSHRLQARTADNICEWRTIGSLDDVEDVLSPGESPEVLASAAGKDKLQMVRAAERPF